MSHNLDAIQRLCKRTILLENGQVKMMGKTEDVINKYVEAASTQMDTPLHKRLDRTGSGFIRFTDFHIEDSHGTRLNSHSIKSNSDVTFVFGYEINDISKISEVDVGFSLHTHDLFTLSVLYGSYVGKTFTTLSRIGEFRFNLNKLPLVEGEYTVGARILVDGEEADYPQNGVGSFVVSQNTVFTSKNGLLKNHPPLMLDGEWEIVKK
ncbi:MAG: Wzt carbohydrate-binding domain-containing protein [Minisyncoccota bacterium]